MATIFTDIIAGKIPSYKIYEDAQTYAFLDIHPETPGHTLVVPKLEIDKVYDLPADYYQALMRTVQRLAQHYEKVLGRRIFIKIIGVDVPHAHVHLVPAPDTPDAPASPNDPAPLSLSPDEMSALAEKLRLKDS